MNRLASPLLYLAHGALFAWLAYCAVQTARNNAPGQAAVFAAGSLLAVLSVVRESLLEEAQHAEAVRAERAARPEATPDRIGDEITLDWALAAFHCCPRGWATADQDHDRATCTRKDHHT